jgi:hypothetical protein
VLVNNLDELMDPDCSAGDFMLHLVAAETRRK